MDFRYIGKPGSLCATEPVSEPHLIHDLMESKFQDFVNEHFKADPKLLNDIKALEKKRNLRLLAQLVKDKNEINFYSWLSEIKFGLYFDTISSELKHNEKIEIEEDVKLKIKTPDWTAVINGQKILTDTLRINVEENELKQRIESLKTQRKAQKENSSLNFIMSSEVKVMSSEYLYGAQTKLVNKESTYRNIIIKDKVPFIICVACTLDTFLGSLDFFDFLIGHTKRGFFYKEKDFGRNVTGVLIRTYYNELVYFHNELAEHQLNQANLDFFNTIHYKET